MIKPLLSRRQPTARLQFINECFETSLAPLFKYAYQGLRCEKKVRTKILVHCSMTFYVPDIQETEDLLGLKREGWTRYHFHICILKTEILHLVSLFLILNLDKSLAMPDTSIICSLKPKYMERKMAMKAMLSAVSVLSKFSLIGIHQCIAVYAMLRLDQMHWLSFGVGRFLK